MHYELVSRTLAYVSCLTAFSLFATSMAITAANVGKLRSQATCATTVCAVATAPMVTLAEATGSDQVSAVSTIAVMVPKH